ncbi:MGMT family protein [Arthrobacter sp. zg-Y820]|uniref:MGMT family protein n=1 Tax=unclassified Arthrobacter TaxID=235627 RepID=UPI001E3E02EA|nr:MULTISPECIES: MGMT family protein [unclassified Arthrobacter]MCC9195943.1 MGMT family protein [Arthrobacter sp. zg-Y820]MDK1278802.1 MGMT family protein [Arthrobacter sp. zg.Y820]WIB08780.1 MGMT family protein [Arthrobacter sp. zg-Y820]
MRNEYVEAVRSVTALIPAGRVLSYGDVAEILDSGGPRQVGAVLSRNGSGLPWWRVIRAGGGPPRSHELRALEQYRSEGTPLSGTPDDDGGGYRVRIAAARWFPTEKDWTVIEGVRTGLAGHGTGMSAGRDEVEA